MIVCHCGVVSDRDVTAAVRDGARSLTDVCRATGAGQNCGGCVLSVRRILCQHGAVQALAVTEVAGAAS
ncbi:MAG TPA: (2Fe-2S)-binding protein [Nocardioidaceae bacterium]|jgi:bacterioferritin-associated ferredoxin|nr:(2Fe-2S)-binding protein [Nocardioidaceae bacterium]